MKSIGILMVGISSIFILTWSLLLADITWKYNNKIGSYWELADKSSTIQEKSIYIDLFVKALEAENLSGKYNALIYKTADNNFDSNLKALKSLQLRLKEISTMNVASFEYQTAIQQITAQEQGEAANMLSVLSGVYAKEHNILIWDWIGLLILTTLIASFITGLCIWISNS